MPDSRIEQLRRRVEKDPASIAFAQLAEEYRRAGEYKEAVRVCQAGLARHPGYFSARVTLGLAFMELGRLEEAQAELKAVLSAAPDNLAAVRALAEIHERTGGLPETPDSATIPLEPEHDALDATGSTEQDPPYVAATEPDPVYIASPPGDVHIETFEPVSPDHSIAEAPAPPDEVSGFSPAAADRASGPPSQHWLVGSRSDPTVAKEDGRAVENPVLEELERWLEAIRADRDARKEENE